MKLDSIHTSNPREVRLNQSEVRLNQTSENLGQLKILVRVWDLWWPTLISYHDGSHLGCQPLPEITNMAATALPLKIEI